MPPLKPVKLLRLSTTRRRPCAAFTRVIPSFVTTKQNGLAADSSETRGVRDATTTLIDLEAYQYSEDAEAI